MKRLIVILCVITINITLFSQAALQNVCVNGALSFSGDGNHGEYNWDVIDRTTGAIVNGAVASISGVSFGVGTTDANTVTISFQQGGKYSVLVRRFVSVWPTGPQLKFSSSSNIDVILSQPIFAFTSPDGDCGATFTLPNSRFQPDINPMGVAQTTLQWSRESANNPNVFVDIANATGTSVTVQQPFVRLKLTATSNRCGTVSSFTQTPPSGLADFNLSDGNSGMSDNMGAIEACTPSTRLQSATARFCGGTNNWTWTIDGSIQLVGPPTNGTAVSRASFKLLSGNTPRTASITATNGTQSRTLFYNILAYPACRNQQQLAKPIDNSPILPSSTKSESDKIAISDDPNSDLNTENTEGVTILNSKNNTSIKKAIYPNPANDVLNVDNIEGVQSIQIMDLNGKLIQAVSIEESEISRTLNVSYLSNGMYILKKIKQDGQLEATKFQVIH